MKTLALLALALILGGCQSNGKVPCSKDLSRPLSSCPLPRIHKGPESEWTTFSCDFATITVRSSTIDGRDYCACLETKNKYKRHCR